MTTALHEQYPAPHPATMLQIMQIQRLRSATEGTMPRSETVIKVSYAPKVWEPAASGKLGSNFATAWRRHGRAGDACARSRDKGVDRTRRKGDRWHAEPNCSGEPGQDPACL